jgi:cytochrome d ubiquinol oxidase subunit II
VGYTTLWLFGFGVLFAGYLALAGFDYGVAIVAPFVAHTDEERRLALNAVGPFFLGNEVWLLVTFGMAAGTVPGLGTSILTGTYPVAVVAVAGAILVNVAVQLRSRSSGARSRRIWDVLICAGGVAAAFGWGAVITAVLGGLALGSDGHVVDASAAVTGFSVLGGLSMIVLLAAHGSVFLAARVPGQAGVRARRSALVMGVLSGMFAATTLVTGRVGGYLSGEIQRPTLALAVLLASVVLVKVALGLMRKGQPLAATVSTSAAVALVPLLVFAGKYPTLLTSSNGGAVKVGPEQVAGTDAALAMITWTAGPVLLVVIAVQAYGWWTFRGKLDRQSPVFY